MMFGSCAVKKSTRGYHGNEAGQAAPVVFAVTVDARLKDLKKLFSPRIEKSQNSKHREISLRRLILADIPAFIMATVVPPPSKRQRTDAADRAREQQDIEQIPSDAGTLRLQFFDETTGLPIGDGPVLVPVADANPKNLELLLNTLQGHVSCKLPLYEMFLMPK
jgi:hypothetical protein